MKHYAKSVSQGASAADGPVEALRVLFDAAVAAVGAERCLRKRLQELDLSDVRRVLVLGAGKAAAPMATAVEHHCLQHGLPVSGMVAVPYGHLTNPGPKLITVTEAGHPHPDAAGLRAAAAQLDLAAATTARDLLIFVASGGGSALLPAPIDGVSLADKRAAIAALMDSGVPISDINQVRKHLSKIKGGRLAAAAGARRVVSYVISDVPGDNPADVASGPTVPSLGLRDEALAIVQACKAPIPASVLAALAHDPEVQNRPRNPESQVTQVVACAAVALDAAAQSAQEQGFTPVLLGDALEGPAPLLAEEHGRLAREYVSRPGRWALISGGETTVNLGSNAAPEARGGRNTEYLAALVAALDGHPGIWAIACDTDGIDGVGGHAGAILRPDSLERAAAAGVDWSAGRSRNATYDLFAAVDDLVVTGPTLTNVNDFRAILIDGDQNDFQKAQVIL